MPRDPKMTRLDTLPPDLRALVEAHLSQDEAERRLRQLVFRNDRLLTAVESIGDFDKALDIIHDALIDAAKTRAAENPQ